MKDSFAVDFQIKEKPTPQIIFTVNTINYNSSFLKEGFIFLASPGALLFRLIGIFFCPVS